MIEFRVLGAVNLLSTDGSELRPVLSQPKRVALLAYLAAASPHDFHRRDSLLALFWPELDQARARAALRQALHGLRRALGDGAIENRGDDEIGLGRAAVWCDVFEFETAVNAGRHAEALELYRGDLLAGFFISNAPEFERWLEDERARVRRRAVEAAWILAGTCKDAGELALAAHWARRAAALVRDDEEALRRLVALLGQVGDRAGALQAYDVFSRRLAEEYEAEPVGETKALIASIRSEENQSPAPVGKPSAPSLRAEPAELLPPETPIDHQPRPALPSPDDPPLATDVPAPRGTAGSMSRRRPDRAAVAMVVVLVVVVFGAALGWGRDRSALHPTRVVVAGVSNRTGDTSLNAVGELAREEITRGLALTEVLEVADPGAAIRTSTAGGTGSLRPGEEAAGARALALATGSGLAVWGTMDRRGNEIEFSATIVDEQSGKILRTLRPVRGNPLEPREALTILRDRIMAIVAEAVDPRLAASASVSTEPPRYAAYDEFIAGVGIWYDGRNGRDALPRFNRAVALDSTFALPLIWAAWVHQTFGQCDSTEAIAGRLARFPVSRLEQLQIDRQMARCQGDLSGAYRLAQSLVEARPRSEVWQEQLARDALNFNRPREAVAILAKLHPNQGALRGRASYYNWLTNAHHLLGEHEAELAVADRGRERFPGNLAVWRTELMALAGLGRGDEVISRLDEIDALSMDPIRQKPTVMREIALDLAVHGDLHAAKQALRRTLIWHAAQPAAYRATEYSRFERAQTYYAAGDADSARALVEELSAANPEEVQYLGMLGVLDAKSGRSATAGEIAEQLSDSQRQYGRGQAAYWRACIAAQLGQRDEAVALLRRALAEGYVFNALFFISAHVEPSFSALRGYSPFEELLRPKG